MEIPSKGTHGLREAGLSMSTAVIQVPFELVQKWQEIVNIIAEIIHVPSALVMKVEPPNIKVFVSSESNGNPYERDELAPLNTGLYLMKTRQSLLVPDALRDEDWKSNPDMAKICRNAQRGIAYYPAALNAMLMKRPPSPGERDRRRAFIQHVGCATCRYKATLGFRVTAGTNARIALCPAWMPKARKRRALLS